MNRSLRVVLAISVIALIATAARAERPADHVVLVSVDGLRPEFYLDESWPAPMMRQMFEEGAAAERVRGVFPSVTYPSHTTILTGALPARHGIYYNAPFEPEGQTGRWYWEEELIQVPTLWDAVRAAGGTTANVGWPVSVGAPVDWNMPEVWSLEPDGDSIAVTRSLTTPPGLWDELEREATGRLTADNFMIERMTRDDRVGDIAAYLLTAHKPTLLTVHLVETDEFQHQEGREGWLVRRAVAAADRAIAQMVEAAERVGMLERTAFIVTGDHGHVDRHTRLAPNVWLVEAGLRSAEPDRGSWRATFHTSGAAAFLVLADPGDSDAVAAARQAVAGQPARIRRMFRVIERQELNRLGASPPAAFALAPVAGINFTSSASDPAVAPDAGATHGYLYEFPEIHTGLIGWGAGFRRGARAPLIEMTDVAPIVAELLRLDFSAPDGMLPQGLVTRSEP